MSTFHTQLMGFTPSERAALASAAGLSINYLHKHTYMSNGAPKFHFPNAVRLEQASRGSMPFTEHTAGAVDWDYVRRSLNRAHRKGVI